MLERGQTKEGLRQLYESLDGYIGAEIYPGLCREWLYRQWRKLPFHPQYAGAHWGEGTRPIDIVAISHEDHGILFGKCNWGKKPVSEDDVHTLIEQAATAVSQSAEEWNVSYAFFSRSGFTRSARQVISNAKCFWVNFDDLDSGLQEDAQSRGRGKLRV